MSQQMKFFIVATVLSLISIGISYKSSESTSAQTSNLIKQDYVRNKILDNIKDKINNLEITIGGAIVNAQEAPGDLDFNGYLRLTSAKKDVKSISEYLNEEEYHTKNILVNILLEKLVKINKDYQKELQKMSTVGRERKRVGSLLLSHRRQMGILIQAIKEVDLNVYSSVKYIENHLNETI